MQLFALPFEYLHIIGHDCVRLRIVVWVDGTAEVRRKRSTKIEFYFSISIAGSRTLNCGCSCGSRSGVEAQSTYEQGYEPIGSSGSPQYCAIVHNTSIRVQDDEIAMTISHLIVRWFDQWFGTTRNIAHVIRTSLYLPGEIWSNPGEIGPAGPRSPVRYDWLRRSVQKKSVTTTFDTPGSRLLNVFRRLFRMERSNCAVVFSLRP
jgi:hypothetical protein